MKGQICICLDISYLFKNVSISRHVFVRGKNSSIGENCEIDDREECHSSVRWLTSLKKCMQAIFRLLIFSLPSLIRAICQMYLYPLIVMVNPATLCWCHHLHLQTDLASDHENKFCAKINGVKLCKVTVVI